MKFMMTRCQKGSTLEHLKTPQHPGEFQLDLEFQSSWCGKKKIRTSEKGFYDHDNQVDWTSQGVKQAPSHRKSNRFPDLHPNDLSDPKDLVKAHFLIFPLGEEKSLPNLKREAICGGCDGNDEENHACPIRRGLLAMERPCLPK